MYKKYLLLVITVVLLAGGAYFTERSFLASSVTPIAPVATTTDAAVRSAPAARVQKPANTLAPTPNVTLQISGTSYGVYAPADATVIDAMDILASTTNFSFTSKEFPGMGAFVESINGKANGDGSSWFLYVNGKSSDTGASQTALKVGDTVEWRYEKNY